MTPTAAAVGGIAAGAATGACALAVFVYTRRDRIQATITARAIRWTTARAGLPADFASGAQQLLGLAIR